MIDAALGVSLTLDGADTTIPEQTLFQALAGDLLAFLGDEICGVISATLTAPNTYRLFLSRALFATPQQAHLSGAEVFLIARADLQPVWHPHFQPNNTARVKVAFIGANGVQDLATAAYQELAITGRIYQAPPPSNLTANGMAANAIYTTGQDVNLAWTINDGGRSYLDPARVTTVTWLEFLVDGEGGPEVVATQSLAAGVGSFLLTNADLVALLGGEVDFTVRIRTRTLVDFEQIDSDTIQLFIRETSALELDAPLHL